MQTTFIELADEVTLSLDRYYVTFDGDEYAMPVDYSGFATADDARAAYPEAVLVDSRLAEIATVTPDTCIWLGRELALYWRAVARAEFDALNPGFVA